MWRQPSITGSTLVGGMLLQLLRPVPARPLPCRQLSLLLIRSFLIFLLLFPAKAAHAANICAQQEQACGAQLRSFPLLEPDEGSGWDAGSGIETVPLYDEFFTPTQIFDFSKPANLTEERMCECRNDTRCLLDEETIIKLDEMITLIFCDRVDDIFRRPCRGARSLIRVIGRIHESGEALTSITETVMFCKCERGYQRIRVEAWFNDLYAFIYRCL